MTEIIIIVVFAITELITSITDSNLQTRPGPSDHSPPGLSTVTGRCLLEPVRAPATLTESSIFINIAATRTDVFQERDRELTSRKFKIWNGKRTRCVHRVCHDVPSRWVEFHSDHIRSELRNQTDYWINHWWHHGDVPLTSVLLIHFITACSKF